VLGVSGKIAQLLEIGKYAVTCVKVEGVTSYRRAKGVIGANIIKEKM